MTRLEFLSDSWRRGETHRERGLRIFCESAARACFCARHDDFVGAKTAADMCMDMICNHLDPELWGRARALSRAVSEAVWVSAADADGVWENPQ